MNYEDDEEEEKEGTIRQAGGAELEGPRAEQACRTGRAGQHPRPGASKIKFPAGRLSVSDSPAISKQVLVLRLARHLYTQPAQAGFTEKAGKLEPIAEHRENATLTDQLASRKQSWLTSVWASRVDSPTDLQRPASLRGT
jgi:hypothetical protein